MVRAIRERLGGRRVQILFYTLAICFACWMRREVVTSGFLADDYAQLGMLDGAYPLKRAAWDLFTFSNGDSAEGEQLMKLGFYPWWSDPTVRISMFRPLASLMVAADFALFGSREWPYHVHSLIWWVALLGVMAVLFRLWLSPLVAALAFLLLCCSNAHGLALAWICNRSAIIATLLSLLSLYAYVRSRSSDAVSTRIGALVLFVVALGFGEYALCGFAYFLAYEAVEAKQSLRLRALALSPFAAAALTFLTIRAALGLSMQRSGVYVDVITDPLSFLYAVVARVPVFAADLLLALRAEYWTFGAPGVAVELSRGWAFARWFHDLASWRLLHQALGAIACLVVVYLTRKGGRGTGADNTRWLLVGALLSLIPVCGSFPSSRLTLAACFGFTPWLATMIVRLFERSRFAAVVLLAYAVIVPCLQQRDEVRAFEVVTDRTKRDILKLRVDDDAFKAQDVVIMGALEGGLSTYLPLTRLRYGRSAPRSCWVVSFVPNSYSIERTQPDAFRIRFHGNSVLGAASTEQLLRDPERRFRLHDTVQVGAMHVTITELFHGMPKMLEFEFDRPLDDLSLLFLFPAPGGFQRFRIPPLGEGHQVPMPVLNRLPDELRADD